MDLVGIEAINGICEAETINDCKVHSFDLDIDFSSLCHTSKVSEQDMSFRLAHYLKHDIVSICYLWF